MANLKIFLVLFKRVELSIQWESHRYAISREPCLNPPPLFKINYACRHAKPSNGKKYSPLQ